jgi:hypothetical protein
MSKGWKDGRVEGMGVEEQQLGLSDDDTPETGELRQAS